MDKYKEIVLRELEKTHRRKIVMNLNNDKLECYILKNKNSKVLVIINMDKNGGKVESDGNMKRYQRINLTNLYDIFHSLKLVEVISKDMQKRASNNIYNYIIYPGDALIIKVRGQ